MAEGGREVYGAWRMTHAMGAAAPRHCEAAQEKPEVGVEIGEKITDKEGATGTRPCLDVSLICC